MLADRSLLRAAWAVLALALLAGCETLAKPWPPWTEQPPVTVAGPPNAELTEIAAWAELFGELAHGDAAARHAVYLRTAEAHARAPTPRTTLHLAAVLGTRGHADADAARAERLLTELEAARDTLPPAITHLARQQRALQRLAAPSAADHKDDCEALNREQRKLRGQLEDAERKIKALSAIERKLEPPPAPRPPGAKR